jgi:hypothetical protein
VSFIFFLDLPAAERLQGVPMSASPSPDENKEQFDNYGPLRGCLFMCALMGGAALVVTLLSYAAAWFVAAKG